MLHWYVIPAKTCKEVPEIIPSIKSKLIADADLLSGLNHGPEIG